MSAGRAPRSRARRARAALAACLALVVTGCATGARKPRLQPPSFNTIAIVSPAEFIRHIGPETASDKAIQGMSVGSGTAAAAARGNAGAVGGGSGAGGREYHGAGAPITLHGRSHSLTLTLPPLGIVFFKPAR